MTNNLQKRNRYTYNKTGIWLLMSMPVILLTLIFSYIPMPGIILAFKNFSISKGIFGSDWVGFSNFKFFFVSQDFWTVTRNTVGYNVLFIILGNLIGLVLAIFMHQITQRYLIKIYQTIMFFPFFLSWVVVGFMLYSFLSPELGMINGLLKYFGSEPVSWYTEPKYWPFIFIIVSIWKGTGSGCVMIYASIIGIDKQYYEAATLDGASKFQMAAKITIPFVMPLITLFVLLGIGRIFRADFGMFYVLPQNIGILKSTTDVIDTYVYNMMRQSNDFGMASAVGLYQSLVGFILIILSNKMVGKINPENSIF